MSASFDRQNGALAEAGPRFFFRRCGKGLLVLVLTGQAVFVGLDHFLEHEYHTTFEFFP